MIDPVPTHRLYAVSLLYMDGAMWNNGIATVWAQSAKRAVELALSKQPIIEATRMPLVSKFAMPAPGLGAVELQDGNVSIFAYQWPSDQGESVP